MSTDAEPDDRDREKLGDRLEKIARKVDGVRRDSFVDSQSICGHCRWVQITRRASKNNRILECQALGRMVPEDIVECNSYSAHNSLSLGQMAEIATLIDNVPPKKVGFHGDT